MLSGYESTLTNLRLLEGLEKKEYLQTSSEGNILSYLGDTFISNIASALYRENWTSTIYCLNKIFVDECPALVSKLIKNDAKKELKKVLFLLEDSRVGLVNLKTVYKEKQYTSHLDTLINDYLNTQVDHARDHLGKIEERQKVPLIKSEMTRVDE